MEANNRQALNALWKSDLVGSDEKIMLYHLTSKHSLGDGTTVGLKDVDRFIEDFSDRWCEERELHKVSNLSEVKAQRSLNTLQEKGYIKYSEKEVFTKKGKPRKDVSKLKLYAITEKLFHEFSENIS